jgi:beta-glucosidase
VFVCPVVGVHRNKEQVRGESMSKTKSFQSLLFISIGGFVAAAACTLKPPATIQPMPFMCNDPDGGVEQALANGVLGSSTADGGAGEGGPSVDNVVTPVSCDNNNAMAVPYVQPYVTGDALKAQVDSVIGLMHLPDKARQMVGTNYSGSAGPQFRDIQRSYDTANVRGFRYRDASSGMNLGEDMEGVKPNAGTFNGEHAGFATSFPVSMARGASFDLDLEYAVGEAIGDEMQAARQTLLLAPCMNILRHPYWGRAQETYSEDSFHIGRFASAMSIGVQQHIAANAKHFMAYDIEVGREQNNAQMDEQTLRETYGRHFRMVVQDGGVASVMASYNKVDGVKSTQNSHTLTDILRTDFGFKGFVLSDWWAAPPSQNAATDTSMLNSYAQQALSAGLQVDLPWALTYGQLEALVNTGALKESDLDPSVRLIVEQKLRFKADPLTGPVGLGAPHTTYANSQISCDVTHRALAQQAALESMVLLKNDSNTLPIPMTAKSVAVIGATVPYVTTNGGTGAGSDTGGSVNFAQDFRRGDLGSSRVISDPSKVIGPFAGICQAVGGTPMETIDKKTNSRVSGTCENAPSIMVTTATTSGSDLSAAMAAASAADFVIVVAGLTAQDEGEQYTQAGDRDSGCVAANCFSLDAKQMDPHYQGLQDNLIGAVAALHKPMVVVLEGASVINLPWLQNVPSLVMGWYSGMEGGAALGKLLFGQANFSGKLPFTWDAHLEDYDTWKGSGGTTTFGYYIGYKWFDLKGTKPVFPFGYGMSYTNYEYRKLQLGCSDMKKGSVLPVYVNVANTGTVAGDEVVQVYVSFVGTQARRPTKELKGFTRVHLAAGEEKQVVIPVRLSDLDYFQQDSGTAMTGHWVVETGSINVQVGGSSDKLPLSQTVSVTGY